MAQGSAGNRTEAPVADSSTAPPEFDDRVVRRGRRLRRVFFVALSAFIGLGLLSRLGPLTGDLSVTGGPVELSVSYPRVNRPGLLTKLSFEVRRSGGFAGPVTLAVNSSYLDTFAEAVVDPQPTTETADDERTIWTFEPPPGADVLVVSMDARIYLSERVGRPAATVSVLEDDQPVVTARFRTYVLP